MSALIITTATYCLVVLLLSQSLIDAKTCEAGQVEDRGFLGLGVFSGCDDCPTGSFQSGNSCEKCSVGTFNNQVKQTECFPCPGGKYSDMTGATKCNICKPGEYSNFGSGKCEECPAGKYSRTAGSDSCLMCPGGSFSSFMGSTKCENCPNGKRSPSGSVSARNCTGACSAGFIHTLVNGTVKCEECSAGEFSLEGALECIPCPNGTSSVQGSGSCIPCSSGTFAKIPGSLSCKQCPPGTVTRKDIGSTLCTPCPENTHSNPNHTVCMTCPRGAFSRAGSASCKICPTDYYLAVNSEECRKCPGETTSFPGSYSVYDCHNLGYTVPTSGTNFMTTSPQKLTSRHVVGIGFSAVGIAAIFGFAIFTFYWTHQRRTFNRNLSQPNSDREKRRCRFGRTKNTVLGGGTPVDYSSCNELRTADESSSHIKDPELGGSSFSKIDPDQGSSPVTTLQDHDELEGSYYSPDPCERIYDNPSAK